MSDTKKKGQRKVQQALPETKPVDCEPKQKPAKLSTPKDEPQCEQSKSYKSAAEQRLHLEKEVIPTLMQGMLELAREQPRDPISYLEKFWLKKQHKCDIPMPDDLL